MIVKDGYVHKLTCATHNCKAGRKNKEERKTRDWWIVRPSQKHGVIQFSSSIHFPPEYIGHRVRLKVEVIDVHKNVMEVKNMGEEVTPVEEVPKEEVVVPEVEVVDNAEKVDVVETKKEEEKKVEAPSEEPVSETVEENAE